MLQLFLNTQIVFYSKFQLKFFCQNLIIFNDLIPEFNKPFDVDYIKEQNQLQKKKVRIL